MRKLLAILLCLVVMLSFAACGADKTDDGADYDDGVAADGNNDAKDDARECYECGKKLGDGEGWLSQVYDADNNLIDVHVCDDCANADNNADDDAGATGDADVDAGSTADADTTANGGGYDRVPQNSADSDADDGDSYTCSECKKKLSLDEACMAAGSDGITYFCSDCYDEWLNS